MAGGRPANYSKKQIEEIKAMMQEYIDNTDIPIVAEFAYKNKISRCSLYDYQEFSTLLKEMIAKKESQLERMALTNSVNSTMAIFSLKQLGWRDKQELEHSGKDGEAIQINIKGV